MSSTSITAQTSTTHLKPLDLPSMRTAYSTLLRADLTVQWRNRRSGMSKLKLREMGSRYLFITLYCWLEKYFSRGDYKKKSTL